MKSNIDGLERDIEENIEKDTRRGVGSDSKSDGTNTKREYFISRYLPSKRFVAINLFGLVVVRKDKENLFNTTLFRHEKIHTMQMIETLFVGFYFWYIIEWTFRAVYYFFKKEKKLKDAYYDILFEREAYEFQDDIDYYKKRRPFQYKWLKL